MYATTRKIKQAVTACLLQISIWRPFTVDVILLSVENCRQNVVIPSHHHRHSSTLTTDVTSSTTPANLLLSNRKSPPHRRRRPSSTTRRPIVEQSFDDDDDDLTSGWNNGRVNEGRHGDRKHRRGGRPTDDEDEDDGESSGRSPSGHRRSSSRSRHHSSGGDFDVDDGPTGGDDDTPTWRLHPTPADTRRPPPVSIGGGDGDQLRVGPAAPPETIRRDDYSSSSRTIVTRQPAYNTATAARLPPSWRLLLQTTSVLFCILFISRFAFS